MQDPLKALSTSSAALPGRQIGICADDFGMGAGIDAGILELARAGRLSAVSCLTQGPTLNQSAAALAQLPVDIGVHLNFTESFSGNQFSLPLARLIAACYARQLPRHLLVATIRRQLDAFESNFGRAPDFIDGHQHVHQLPTIREPLLEGLRQRYPGRRIWVRSTCAAPDVGAKWRQRCKARLIALLGARAMRRLTTAAGLSMNRCLLGIYDFSASAEQYRQLLLSWFAAAGDRDLLMCHPASALLAGDPIGRQRLREFSVLGDDRFPAWLERQGLSICRLSIDDPTNGQRLETPA